jgi:hypothetical protein
MIDRQICLNLLKSFFIFFVFILCFCKKEKNEKNPPLIEFINDAGYVHSDTSVSLGTSLKIGIKATKSGEYITYLNVSVNNGTIQTALDSGMYTDNLLYKKTIIKSNSQIETWTFIVMDKNRNKSAISLKLIKKNISIFGDINYYPSVILGAQNNITSGNFYSLTGNIIYNQQDAFNNQPLIDFIYYYGQYNATLSSPGETEAPLFYTGTTGIPNWALKNVTLYDTTLVTSQQFDSSINDSLLLVQYDQVNGKKKAKYMQPGLVFSFINNLGKIGLFKVVTVNGTDSGTLEIAVKIQK